MKKSIVVALAVGLAAAPALAEREQTGPNEIGYVFQWPTHADIARSGKFKGCLPPNTAKWFNNNGDVIVRDEIITLSIAEQLFTERFDEVLTADNLTMSLRADVRIAPDLPGETFEATCREVFEKYHSASETNAQDVIEPSWYNMIVEERFRFLVREEIAQHLAKDIPNARMEIAKAIECKLREFLMLGPSEAYGQSFHRDTLACDVDSTGGSHFPFRLATATVDEIQLPVVIKDATNRLIDKNKEVVAERHNVEIERMKLDKVRIYAESQAAFLREISESITPEILEYQAVQALGNFICPEAKVTIIPNENVNILISDN